MHLLIITEAEPLSHSVYTYNSDITHTYCRDDSISEYCGKKTMLFLNPVIFIKAEKTPC